MVGRRAEIERLEALIEGASSGSATLALVGEPGIGKTRLLGELSARADEAGALVLEGRCAEFDLDAPFGVFVDALDDYLRSQNPRVFERLSAGERSELARLFPALAELAEEQASPLQDERYRAHGATRALLELLAARRPLVLVLDDLHWADDASQELIAHLIRRRPGAKVLLALALRPHEAPERLRGAIEAGERSDELSRLELGPLSREEAFELLPGAGDKEVRARLYDESGGNPFYLEQLHRETSRPLGTGVLVAGTETELPDAVRSAIAGELGRLPDREATMILGAAVIGEAFEPDLAAAAAGIEEADSLAALDELAARDLVRATDVPRRFRFRHPIVRRAVYESAKPGWRLAAHARAAAALEQRGASVLERARHVECSASPGDEAAVEVLKQAGAAAAARAPGSAAHWYDAALRLLPSDAESLGRRLEIQVPMATALGSAGKVVESRDVLLDVLEELPPEMAPLRVQILPFVGLLEHLLGNHDAVPPMLERALAELDDRDSPESVRLLADLATDRFYVNDNETLDGRARDALAAAERLGDPTLEATAWGLSSVGAYKVADIERAEDAFAKGRALVDGLDDGALAVNLFAPFWLGWYGQCAERYEESVIYLDRGLAISRATGQGFLLVPMLIAKAILLTWLGRLADAAELADDALEVARLTSNPQSLAWALTLRCWIATLSGDLQLAVACGTEAVEVSAEISDNYFSKLAGCYLGEAKLESGDPAECVRLITESAGPGLDPLERPFRSHFYEILTRASIAAGDPEAADGWAARAEAAVEGVSLPGKQADALRARAAVELATGDAAAAATLANKAVDGYLERSHSLEAARTKTLAGSALIAAGKGDEGGAMLEQAISGLRALGADRFADQAARELRGTGRRVARRGKRGASADAGGVDSLSGREREVAELVATGKTNKQIAAELYLSEKTIESHLSRIFGKLDVSKRAQLAAVIEREREPAG